MLILTIVQLDITLDLFSLFTLLFCFTQVLVTWSLLFLCAIVVKVDVFACEYGVKVNYLCSILS